MTGEQKDLDGEVHSPPAESSLGWHGGAPVGSNKPVGPNRGNSMRPGGQPTGGPVLSFWFGRAGNGRPPL